jgi:hypothetical protein
LKKKIICDTKHGLGVEGGASIFFQAENIFLTTGPPGACKMGQEERDGYPPTKINLPKRMT